MISPQGFECKVLRPYLSLAAKDTFIPYIFMEWMHVKNNLDNNCPDLAGLIAMFVEKGYTPWNVYRKTELDAASEIYVRVSTKFHGHWLRKKPDKS